MKLSVKFELPLPSDRLPYLELLARHYGWSPERYPDTTAINYICNNVCVPQARELFRGLIADGLLNYLGRSQIEAVNEITQQYNESHSITAEIIDEPV
jgi:hypothetical protein